MRAPLTLVVVATLTALPGCTERERMVSAYARELTESDQELARLDRAGDRLKRVRQYYLRACLTADFSDFSVLEREIDEALSAMGPLPTLVLAKASLELKLHRPDAARQTLEMSPPLKDTPNGRALLADIALQLGRYKEARAGFEAAVDEQPGWENLSRHAYYHSMTGEPDEADRLYTEAQNLLTAKDMHDYAWLELQRGIIDFNAGRYESALAHYRHADQAYSGYWLIEEHMAEVLALLGHEVESARIYAKVVNTTNKPEMMIALAGVVADRDPGHSTELTRAASEAFEQQMALYPRAAVGHYLSFLINTEPNKDRLIELARMNLDARPNADSKLLLARAYLTVGEIKAARALVTDIEAAPWRPKGLAELKSALRLSRDPPVHMAKPATNGNLGEARYADRVAS